MLRRILAFVSLTSFVCLARPVPNPNPSPVDPAGGSPPAVIDRPHPLDAPISIVRLSVPEKARRLYDNALTAFMKQRLAEAKTKLDEALHLCPAFPDALTLRGGVYLNQDRLDAAEDDFLTAIRFDPAFLSAYIGLADLYNQESRFDDALAITGQANAMTPRVWNVQYEVARAFIGKGQYDRALAVIDATLISRPDDHRLLNLAKAHALVGLQHYSQAEAELQTYLADERSADDERARDLLDRIQTIVGQ